MGIMGTALFLTLTLKPNLCVYWVEFGTAYAVSLKSFITIEFQEQ